jgi:hypothetical protein
MEWIVLVEVSRATYSWFKMLTPALFRHSGEASRGQIHSLDIGFHVIC